MNLGDEWILDSGASAHFSRDRSSFRYSGPSQNSLVTLARGQAHVIHGQRTAQVFMPSGKIKNIRDIKYIPSLSCNILSQVFINSGKIKNIKDINYIPSLSCNILSVGKITNVGHLAIFDETNCVNTKTKPFQIISKGQRHSNTG
jgi:hypothetical protein